MPATAALAEVPAAEDFTPSASPAVAPIDLAHLRRYTLGNGDLEREVLELFKQHVPDYMHSLRQASGEKDWHAAAHTIKGSAGAVGAWQVAQVAAIAEKLKSDPDPARRDAAIATLQLAVSQACDHISQLYGNR